MSLLNFCNVEEACWSAYFKEIVSQVEYRKYLKKFTWMIWLPYRRCFYQMILILPNFYKPNSYTKSLSFRSVSRRKIFFIF